MPKIKYELAKRIRASERNREPVNTELSTDERVLARITDGIYRQPSSALRELISNAYDADATEVTILTDAPRFTQISVRDNGFGLSPEALEHLIKHIGGSPKQDKEGKELGITAKNNQNLSPGGRQLIGKLGIGLFSVAQFTRHFLVMTKTKGDRYSTIADITLGAVSGEQKILKRGGKVEIETGSARIWRELAPNPNSHGTEIKLLELLPRTRAELASDDLWVKLELEKEDDELVKTKPPTWHIGRMMPKQDKLLSVQPKLPWDQSDKPKERFEKLIRCIRDAAEIGSESVNLEILFDRYLQTIWTLALSAPLKYIEGHPFDLVNDGEFRFFDLENHLRGQAKELSLKTDQTPRKTLKLITQDGTTKDPFDVFIDGLQLFRPILYKDLPKTKTAVTSPLLFIGHNEQKFEKKPVKLSGGPLKFEAYLFWSPVIIPKQHRGVIVRVGNTSGALFDPTFMGYQVSEQTRTRQITAEIFVLKGLEEAINIDRESFNYAHPHYQYLVKWLHSALRQLANKHKGIGSSVRLKKLEIEGKKIRERVEERVVLSLKTRGVEDMPEVVLLDKTHEAETPKLRKQGIIVLRKDAIIPPSSTKYHTTKDVERNKLAEKKAIAVTQLLDGWGLLEKLTYEEQEELIREILGIILFE